MNWSNFELPAWARRLVGGSALVSVAGIVLSQTLLAPTYEVLYSGSMTVAHCFNVKGRETCVFTYALSVGNTGKQPQDTVRVVWPLDMQSWDVGAQVADIVASANRTPEARIRRTSESDRTVYEIDRLMPNTLVEFRVRCLQCAPSDFEAMRQARVSVEARGVVSEADPRVSALRHGAMNLLRVVGLFR